MEPVSFGSVYKLFENYLNYTSGQSSPETSQYRTSLILQNLTSTYNTFADEELWKLMDTLELNSVEDACRIFNLVMEGEFADGKINWGRILTIFLFGGILVKKLQTRGIPMTHENIRKMSEFMTTYFIDTKTQWFNENRGKWVNANLLCGNWLKGKLY